MTSVAEAERTLGAPDGAVERSEVAAHGYDGFALT